MKIAASIQARLSSSRLPGKVLKQIGGKPLLAWQLERLSQSLLLDQIIVATSSMPADDPIFEFCRANNVQCFRGPEEDVLERISSLIQAHSIDVHVEAFGDSPLVDAEIVDSLVGYFIKNIANVDFVTNSYDCGFPAGTDVNVFSGKILLETNRSLKPDDPNREHVGFNIANSGSYNIKKICAPIHLHAPDLFIEVDTIEDFEVVKKNY